MCVRADGLRDEMNTPRPFTSGVLVNARGREWVVLPESTADLLMLRPVGGLDEDVTGVLPGVDPVETASFRHPGREDLGDFTSSLLLRDAGRLSTRSAAGPSAASCASRFCPDRTSSCP